MSRHSASAIAEAGERRDYYRIDERAMLGLRVVGEAEREAGVRELDRGEAPYERVDDLLLTLDAQLQQQLAGIGAHNAAVASALALMNRKLGLLERMVRTLATAGAGGEAPALAEQVLNLSAGGFAVAVAEPLAAGAAVEVELVLLPSYRYVRCFGRVVDCRESAAETPPWQIAVRFESIREEDRDLLVRHVFTRQSEARRAARAGGGQA